MPDEPNLREMVQELLDRGRGGTALPPRTLPRLKSAIAELQQVYALLEGEPVTNEPEQTRTISSPQSEQTEQILPEQSKPNNKPEQIKTHTLRPENYGLDNCQCKHCQTCITNKNPKRLNHGAYMTAAELEQNGYDLNRVTLPGDIDYNGALTGGLTITN